MNRRLMLLALGLVLTTPVFQTPIFFRYYKSLPGLHIVKSLPSNIVAGTTYEWAVSFVNPKGEGGLMDVTLEITEEHGIGFGEFLVEGTLEAYNNPQREHTYTTLTFTEVSVGTFQALQTSIEKRFNHLTLKIASVPNLMPGKYTLILNIIISY